MHLQKQKNRLLSAKRLSGIWSVGIVTITGLFQQCQRRMTRHAGHGTARYAASKAAAGMKPHLRASRVLPQPFNRQLSLIIKAAMIGALTA